MFDQAIARAIVLLGVAALVWVGLAFAGIALAAALMPIVGLAWAAAITALALLLPAGIWVLVMRVRVGARYIPPQASGNSEGAVLAALSSMAHDRPLLAVLSAGLFGAVDVLLKERR